MEAGEWHFLHYTLGRIMERQEDRIEQVNEELK